MNSDPSRDRLALLEATLLQRILSMRMAPGSALVEAALCSEFGVSRPPIRELIHQLAGQGFINREVNRSAKVAMLSIEHFRHFADSAPLIYISTAQLASMNATTKDMNGLREIHTRFEIAVASHAVEECTLLEHEFYSRIGRIARNTYLVSSLDRLLIDHVRIQNTIYQSQARSQVLSNLHDPAGLHSQVVAAIELHDSQASAQAARQLSGVLRQRIRDYLGRQRH